MEAKILNQDCKEVWVIELNDAIFNVELNEWLVHRALVYQLANSRNNIAHTKTRGERRWSTRKIYRQKWTWRARMGSNRSPIRKKWGVAFWPRNTQNFTLSMNKKERRKAIFCVLSAKLNDNNLYIMDNIEFDSIKTNNMVKLLSNIPTGNKYLLAISEKNEVVEKSISNVPYAKSILVNYLNVSDLLKYDTLILLKDSVEKLNLLLK